MERYRQQYRKLRSNIAVLAESSKFNIPVLGFAAYSGTGKTSLLEKVLPLMRLQGLRVAMIKHTHHDFEMDQPGKDSYKLRKAGARQVMLVSGKRNALITEYDVEDSLGNENWEPELTDLVLKLDTDNIDIVMVEGYRHVVFPKIELHRPSLGKPFLFKEDNSIIAVASDVEIPTGELPLLNINEPEEIAGFINRWLDTQKLSKVSPHVEQSA